MEQLRERVFQAVLAEGFDRVGALPLDQAGDPRFQEWLDRGHHGRMGYLERHAPAKTRPAEAFPEHRSVVVAAMEYGEGTAPSRDPRTGNISRYALGRDYHRVLKERLLAASRRLQAELPELRARAFVDTGPLNEKLVAARAGIGWVGKHTNLIDHTRGSYLFLGLLLVDAELPATGPPARDRCGVCSACIPACPTGAIIAPYVLDARRCISYLTIELRGPIPRELRAAIGNRIFGCDDCQEVCPWNRFARREPPSELASRKELRTTSLEAWLRLDEASWQSRFADSAVQRAGYHGFLRNVLVAAGCSRDQEVLPAVLPFLEHQEPLLRGHAAWAAGAIGGETARQRLLAAKATEQDSFVLEELDAALGAGAP